MIKKLFIAFITCSIPFTLAATTPLVESLKKLDRNHAVSFYAKDLTTNKTLVNFHGNRSQPPASTMKLLTSVIALKKLGPNYRFTTTFDTYGHIQKNTLRGLIELSFNGDPGFSRFTLRQWFKELSKKDVKLIKGNIHIVDPTNFVPLGRLNNELNDCYGRLPSAASIDQNCSIIKVSGTHHGKQAKITMPSRIQGLIENKVISSNRCKYESQEPSGHLIFHDKTAILHLINQNNSTILTGCIHPKHYTVQITVAPPKQAFLKNQILDSLRKNHITLIGDIKIIPRSLGANQPLILHKKSKSQPVKTLLKRVLMNSDNHIAEALYLQSGKTQTNLPSWLSYENQAKTTLSKMNMHFDSASILDGSGLSRYNHITTKQMVNLLDTVYKTPSLKKHIWKFLPISGVRGTLVNRLKTSFLKGKIRAKTGTLKDTSTLAGYVIHKNHTVAFSLAVDGNKNCYQDLKKIENKIFNQLLKSV